MPPDTTDSVATDPVTDVVATPGAGLVDLAWTLPASANVAGARIYRNAVDDFATSTREATVYGGPSAAQTYTATLPAATYYVWVVAINGSGIEATEVATGAVAIT